MQVQKLKLDIEMYVYFYISSCFCSQSVASSLFLIDLCQYFMWMNRAMLELDQILRANEINFAVLAALPALCLSFGLIYLVRVWVTQVRCSKHSYVFFPIFSRD